MCPHMEAGCVGWSASADTDVSGSRMRVVVQFSEMERTREELYLITAESGILF